MVVTLNRRRPDRIHLLSILNGQPHPKAQQKIVDLLLSNNKCRLNGRVRVITGPFMFVQFSSPSSTRLFLHLYHWPTWNLIKVRQAFLLCRVVCVTPCPRHGAANRFASYPKGLFSWQRLKVYMGRKSHPSNYGSSPSRIGQASKVLSFVLNLRSLCHIGDFYT